MLSGHNFSLFSNINKRRCVVSPACVSDTGFVRIVAIKIRHFHGLIHLNTQHFKEIMALKNYSSTTTRY